MIMPKVRISIRAYEYSSRAIVGGVRGAKTGGGWGGGTTLSIFIGHSFSEHNSQLQLENSALIAGTRGTRPVQLREAWRWKKRPAPLLMVMTKIHKVPRKQHYSLVYMQFL